MTAPVKTEPQEDFRTLLLRTLGDTQLEITPPTSNPAWSSPDPDADGLATRDLADLGQVWVSQGSHDGGATVNTAVYLDLGPELESPEDLRTYAMRLLAAANILERAQGGSS